MTENTVINIPENMLNHLQCNLCKGYLSSSPVRVLPDGNCVCGNCSLLNDQTKVYRVFALETILAKIEFPCRYRRHGCAENVLFDKTLEHESKCCFRYFACPLFRQMKCKWEGTSSQIYEHFLSMHCSFIKQKVQFKVKINQDLCGLLLAQQDDASFIAKYKYDAKQGDLRFILRYCRSKTISDIYYKVQFINDLDSECSVSLKMNRCFQFDDNFYEMQHADILNINTFLQCLDNPSEILVVIHFQINNVTTRHATVDYRLLNSLRCYKCSEYLIPPFFSLEGNTICCTCSKDYQTSVPYENSELKEYILLAKYPCRWRGCNFIGNSTTIKDHEVSCQFRYYTCLFKDCHVTFKLSSAIMHFQCHKTVYSPDKIVYKTSFIQPHRFKHVFTIKNGTIISVQYSVVDLTHCNVHRVSLHSSSPNEIIGNLDFEHQHCKFKSKVFTLEINKEIDISIDELPRCFKVNEELGVSINLN